ncbi:GTP-binding protein [Chloropicon primus]|nr:GTP-binding protein [Chloropicon primus]
MAGLWTALVEGTRRREREKVPPESLFSSPSPQQGCPPHHHPRHNAASGASGARSVASVPSDAVEESKEDVRDAGRSRYDKISRRRSEHLRKFRVDTYDLLEHKGGRNGEGKPKGVSNRALFRQTPVDANVMEKIKTLKLCEENRAAQRVAKGKVRAFKKEVSPNHKVPVQMRFYPFFGALDPEINKFLGIPKRDKLRLVTTCGTVKQVEEATEASLIATPIEVAFAGRSNVGKSSLINALSLATCARSANVPGYTQSLHFYALRKDLSLVDMPGYGYASAGYDQVDDWNDLVDSYLVSRGKKRLRRVYVVIDSRHGIKQNDREFLHMLSKAKVKFQVVMNKTDACKPSDLAKRWWHVNEEIKRLPNAVHRIHMCSSRTGAGVQEITKELYHLTSHIIGTTSSVQQQQQQQ